MPAVWNGTEWISAISGPQVNQQTGTTYTLSLNDTSKVVECLNANPITLTIPSAGTVAFPIGTIIEIYQSGAGQVTIVAAGGVTLRAPNGNKTAEQYSSASIRKHNTDEWVLAGDTVE